MKVNDIAQQIEQLVPKALAQEWDNVGLLVGDAAADVETVMLSIDI